ncbi:indole-3-glycerol phosphate synthase TrpC [Virgibacillus sp. YIM 98842]|uniref:indole-3-glycerol phosphate synthase TrpC n=1 Tax=Virgibacillus sp. YIM 98842 TaxID=2663533 RepID=UPI0013DA9A88|nr:indole-3-glycerol phosphate synthase TrpC [Virgibacillus sp. YIM 98842]
MSILQRILVQKEKEAAELLGQTFQQQHKRAATTFKKIISRSDDMGIIAEIKRASPSKGNIQLDVNPADQAKKYEEYGASAISVLTDRHFFSGSMDDLRAVREAVDLPVLCKDFIIHPIQIDRAKAAGADIILLIAAALPEERLELLYNHCRKLDLEVLCEVHNEAEMRTALKHGFDIIGINNRDLNTFEVDLNTTSRLAAQATNPDTILVSESGIKNNTDILHVKDAGADAVLVGETLMAADNLNKTFQMLTAKKHVKGV